MPVKNLESGASELLRQSGIVNPRRLVKLIRDAISFLALDLAGLTVLTEAASGPYVVTPVIAALAGAEKVISLTRDSRFAAATDVIAQTEALSALAGAGQVIEIHTERSAQLFSQADIITNLGFVRPIDTEAIAAMKSSAVVPLMCEAWEFRPGDLDLEACQQRSIPVLGTNEDYPGLEVFAYSGLLCQKMLFDAGIELHKSKVLVVGGDKFGRVIRQSLARLGVEVHLISSLSEPPAERLAAADAVVVADYTRAGMIIGPDGDVASEDFARMAPTATVIQFAGRIDVRGLVESGVAVFPGIDLGSCRMAKTLAELGPRPVVELHAAGLKIGELAVRNRQDISRLLESDQSLVQIVRVRSG